MTLANLRKRADMWKGISRTRRAAKAGLAVPAGEEGFTLVELLIVLVIIPLIIGAVAAALIVILNNTIPSDRNGTTDPRLADSHDAQVTSAYFVRDVQSAVKVSTSSAGVCPHGNSSQLLGLEWSTANGTSVDVSYSILAATSTPAAPPQLVRYYCSGATFSSSVVSHDVFTGLTSVTPVAGGTPGCVPTSTLSSCAVSGGKSYVWVTAKCTDGSVTCAASGLTPVLKSSTQAGISSIQVKVLANATTNFSYTLTGTPRLVSSVVSGHPSSMAANPPFISNGLLNLGNCTFNASGTIAVNDAAPGSIVIGPTGNLRGVLPTPIYTTNPIPSGASGPISGSGSYATPVVSGGPVASPYQKLLDPVTSGGDGWPIVDETATNWDPSTDASVHVGGAINQPLKQAIYVVHNGMSTSKGINGTDGVLFYVTGGNVNLAGNGNVALSPLSPPPWEQTVDGSPIPLPEVVLWISQNDVTPNNPPTLTLGGNGNATTITGAVYAPTTAVTINGGGTNGGIITQSLDVGSISTCNGGGSVLSNLTIGDTASTGTFGSPTQPDILLGQSNTDTVDVIGSIIPNFPPAGQVTFLVCGPEDPTLGCSSTNPNQVLWNIPKATLTSDANSTSTTTSAAFRPTTPGAYCFAALYPGNGAQNYSASSDTSSDECFTVSATTIDATITSPTAGTCYGTSPSHTCSTPSPWPASAISGTTPGAGIAKVTITIQDSRGGGKYWDPSTSTFSSQAPIAIPATDTAAAGDWSTWTYNFPVGNFPPNGDTGGYTITATATSNGTPPVIGQSQALNFTWGG